MSDEVVISPVRLIAPEVVPGGVFGGDARPEDQRWKQLQDIINNLITIINNQQTEINNITIISARGGGLNDGCRVIGHTPVGTDLNSSSFTELTRQSNSLRLHTSGQMIMVWREYTGAGNLYNTRVVKAASPYVVWTNLEGDSQEPTTISPGIQESGGVTMYVVNKASEALHFFFQDSATGDLLMQTYTYDGENFAAGTSSTVLSGLTTGVKHNDIISTNNHLLMALNDQTLSRPCRVYSAPTDTPAGWAEIAHFGDAYYGGAIVGFGGTTTVRRQFVDIGNNRVLLLFHAEDTSGRKNLAWAMSTDGGATWPVGDITTNPAVFELNYPNQASGFVIPQSSGGNWTTGNFISSATSFCWHAAHIAGTSRVGLIYLADYLAAAGTKTGVLYCEFDADTLTWTDQADHVQLTPQNLSTDGVNYYGLGNIQTGPSLMLNSGGQFVTGNDGTARAYWVNGSLLAGGSNGQDALLSLGYRRINNLDVASTDTSNWWSQKEIMHFVPLAGNSNNIPYFVQTEPEICRDGLVEINSQYYLPMVWNRRINSALTRYMAEWEICFKLIPVALMDIP